jgi:hypothetical protein
MDSIINILRAELAESMMSIAHSIGSAFDLFCVALHHPIVT